VLFTGMLRGHERVEALADADLFALPSEHVNFGIVVVEALACGVPVVVSEGVAIADEIASAGVGGVVPVGDVDKLAAAMAQWLQDTDARRRAVERARPFVWERFDWNQVAKRWVEHYRGLLDRSRASARVPV
jgi:glycosyltransferase involved in cell wall biosynthesis